MDIKNKYFRIITTNQNLDLTERGVLMLKNLNYEFGIKFKNNNDIWLLDKLDVTYVLRLLFDDCNLRKEHKIINNELFVPIIPQFRYDYIKEVIDNTYSRYIDDFEYFSLKIVQDFS